MLNMELENLPEGTTYQTYNVGDKQYHSFSFVSPEKIINETGEMPLFSISADNDVYEIARNTFIELLLKNGIEITN